MSHIYNSTYDECLAALQTLSVYYSANLGKRNEATTRLHLIDRLLFECLGWEHREVVAEEHQRKKDHEYTDYTFFAPRRVMILEAKKEGVWFEIPDSKVSRTYTIKSITKGNPKLRSAIDQVSGYCQSRGVPVAMISNGWQVVGFIGNRSDGIPPLDGKCLVFPSPQHMETYFPEFWAAFSRRGLEDKLLFARLAASNLPELPPTLASHIDDYPGTKGRNVYQSELKHISELVIEDIPESEQLEKRFLTECYTENGALSQYSLASRDILQARYDAMFDESSGGRPATISATDRKTGIRKELYADSMSRRPILLLGDVGVGKSMFIKHLMGVRAVEIFASAIALRVDLGSSASLSRELKDFVLKEIQRQLVDKYDVDISSNTFVRGVYDLDLKKFKNSIYGSLEESDPAKFRTKEIEYLEKLLRDESEHCRRALEHISKAHRKQIVLFIDNADQRGDATQDEAFLIAQEIAARWPALVYVPLRPETFHRSVDSGALSGYHPRAFTISPPRVDRVLEKRLRFADEIIQDRNIQAISANPERLNQLRKVIKSFLETLGQEGELMECIDNLSGGNTRLALKLVRDFFGSGHVDTAHIVERVRKTGRYTISLHQFLRAAIYGDYVHYHPERSIFANVFATCIKLTLRLCDVSVSDW